VELGGPIDSPEAEDVFDDLLQFGIATAMARPDRLMIHGAVVARDGDALVVVGPSGQGKSTLAAAALLGGWELLGDDLAVVHPEAPLIQGVQRAPMVPAEIAERHRVTGTLETGPRRRVRLPVSVLQSAPRRLIGVVTIEHGDDGGMEPLLGADLRTLDDALAVPPFRAVIRRQLAAAAALVALPTVLLSHARDPGIRVERAQASLDDVFAYCRDESP
jgi:hypothetical protein